MPALRHGWALHAARPFSVALERLESEVRRLRPEDLVSHPKAKLLARIVGLIGDEIPRDPATSQFQLGNTLGPAHRHWRRAKFLGRFRLFFRFDRASRIIVYAWVNDETTLRKAGGRSDPYAVFARRLDAGEPPDDWDDLLAEARAIDVA